MLVQRISSAHVSSAARPPIIAAQGLLVLVGFTHADTLREVHRMIEKLLHLRLIEDAHGRPEYSLLQQGGDLVLVPQFTLYADCRRGRRASYHNALALEPAAVLFQALIDACAEYLHAHPQFSVHMQHGWFGAKMRVELVNEGPLSFWLDSEELFAQPAQQASPSTL